MEKRTLSLLEELSRVDIARDRDHIIERRAENAIAAVSNLLELISESYDEETAADLSKRFMNSVRTQDVKKFQRGIRKVNEDRRHNQRRT